MRNTFLETRRSTIEACWWRCLKRSAFGPLPLALLLSMLWGCDTASINEDPADEGSVPDGAEMVVRRDGPDAALLGDRAHWADGYVLANDATSASYSPDPKYAFNRSGGAIQITKPAGTTGVYRVRFARLSSHLGSKSTVKVTGYGANDGVCKPVSPTLANDVVEVRCYRATTGGAVNAQFSVLVTRSYPDLAFAYAHKAIGNDYAPLASSSWNPSGPMRVFRDGVGRYRVRFTGLGGELTSNGGHVQVSAVGTGSRFCKVENWGGTPDLNVNVRCFTRGGSPTDTKFNVLFLLPAEYLAFAWAHQPTIDSYTAFYFYSSIPNGDPVQIRRMATGLYEGYFHHYLMLDGGVAQVTAYGSGNEQCKVTSWVPYSVFLQCFTPNGTPVDTYFTVLLGS